MRHNIKVRSALLMSCAALIASACGSDSTTEAVEPVETETVAVDAPFDGIIDPEIWPTVKTAPLDPVVEARIDQDELILAHPLDAPDLGNQKAALGRQKSAAVTR